MKLISYMAKELTLMGLSKGTHKKGLGKSSTECINVKLPKEPTYIGKTHIWADTF